MAPNNSQKTLDEAPGESYETVLNDINGSIYGNVEGFYEKYFENKLWSSAPEEYASVADEMVSRFPHTLTRDSFLEWLLESQSKFVATHRTFRTNNRPSSNGQHLPSLFLVPSRASGSSGEYSNTWADLLVIGEVSQGTSSYRQQFLHLCQHAQRVFKSQHTRRFLHGFYIHGSMMELWVFDRSGPYSSEILDIRKNPSRFTLVMNGYAQMSDEELGINTFIKNDEQGKYIMLKGDDRADVERIYLQDQPIAFAPDLVCNGTTAYRAKGVDSKEWEFVVKFTWRLVDSRQEEDILRLIKQRKVWGVVQLFGLHDLDSISNLRRGLQFGSPRMLPSKDSKDSDEKQSAVDTSIPAADDGQAVVDKYAVETKPAGTDGEKHPSFLNRKFSCIVLYPPGRAMDEFESIPELLGAFSDIAKGLCSLYQDGRILHQDVSKNNLMITDVQKEGHARGFLIDFDAAKLLDDLNTKEEVTGTRLFMAIGVLKARPHTYRHDLESLFYCLLWIASTYRQEGLPKDSNFYGWVMGSFDDCARNKSKDMGDSEFQHIISGFTSEFKDNRTIATLVQELRSILFPKQDGSLFKGSDIETGSVTAFSHQMIDALDKAVMFYERGGESGRI